MCVVYTILAAAAEAGIDGNWYLLNNESTWNSFINGKYLSNIMNAPGGQYLHDHFNSGVTYKNNIGDPPGYPNPAWFNPKGVFSILSLGLMHNHHLVEYNSQDRKHFAIHIPQQLTFNITKEVLFYHDRSHLLNNKKNS